MKKTLSEFLINTSKVNQEKLTETLEPYLIGIDKDKGTIILDIRKLQSLSSANKIMCFLLAVKATFILDKRDNDQASWKEICEVTGMPGGTVRPALMQLKKTNMVSGTNGNYNVPNHIVHVVNLDEKVVIKNDTQSNGSEPKVSSNKKSKTEFGELTPEMFLPYIELLSQSGSYLERSLSVLKLAKDAGRDGLTPKEIENILTEYVRQPISNKNISFSLGKKGKAALFTMRTKKGKAYVYRLTPNGEKAAEQFITGKNKQ